MRVVALGASAFDVGLEHRDALVGVRGDVGDENDWYVAGVALGSVLEWLSGAWLGMGTRTLLGVGVPVDFLD